MSLILRSLATAFIEMSRSSAVHVQAFAIVLLISSTTVLAQEKNQYDKGTPPQHAAGVSPLGSYTTAELGNINLSNGALNFSIPLGSIGGRGFSFPLTLNYSSKIWSAATDTDEDHAHVEFRAAYAEFTHPYSTAGFYGQIGAGWSVGAAPALSHRVLRIQRIASGPSVGCYTYTLPKLTMQLPGNGEIEFRDDIYDGAPLLSTCSGWSSATSRGSRWHATDGSGMIYISDSDNAASEHFGNLSGVVVTSDGTRYRFNGNKCASITDRNGNQITINYVSANEVQYVDQLGRVTKLQRTVADPDDPSVTLALLVTLPGYNGLNRYYKIRSGIMSDYYRDTSPTLPVITGDYDPLSKYPNQSGTKLFPLSYAKFFQRIDNRTVLSEVILPDNRSLKFKYNKFGEVAEAELPTGGKIWYEFQNSFSLPAGNSPEHETTAEYHTTVPIDRALSQRKTFSDGATLDCTWNYVYTDHSTTVTATSSSGTPMLNQVHHFMPAGRYMDSPNGAGAHDGTYYTLWSTGVEWRTDTKDEFGSVIVASEQDWTQRQAVAWSTYPAEQVANDNRVNAQRKILDDGSVATISILYDLFNNPIETNEFDFDTSLKRRTVTSYSGTNPVNGVNYAADSIRLIRLPLQQSVYDGTGIEQARSITEYDVYSGDGYHANLLAYNPVTGHDTGNYGVNKTTRGNITRVGRWIKTSNSYLYNYSRYDILGNVVSIKDARENVAEISFTDDFGNGSNPGVQVQGVYGATYALPTMITSPPPVAGAPVHTARIQYDFSSGLPTGFKDRNGIISQTLYNDPFGRPTQIKSALGTSLETHSRMYYAPATVLQMTLTNNDVLSTQDQVSIDDEALRSWTRTDQFGRTIETWTRDPQGDVKVSTEYDKLGRVQKQSNPYRQSENPAYATSLYDLAGRVISRTTTDNAAVTTLYSGNSLTVTDQSGRKRRSITDGLGRLVRVDEPDGNNNLDVNGAPFQSTNYTYDALDNLITVNQGGQMRSFVYDSLRRLISATYPENGMTCYGTVSAGQCQANGYDPNGNLIKRTDARGVVATLAYDALNRNTSVTYTGDPENTPTVNRYYDGWKDGVNNNIPNSKGRVWQTVTSGDNGLSNTIESLDVLGRPLKQRQKFNSVAGSQTYFVSRSYDLAGHVLKQTYPSGHTVSYNYDDAGRLADRNGQPAFSGNLGEGVTRTYATDVKYNQWGATQQEKFGTDTPLYHKQRYNERGQLWDVRLSTVSFSTDPANGDRGAIVNYYSNNNNFAQGGTGTDNNGNLLRQEIYIPGSGFFRQNYHYDSLNRLDWVTEQLNGTGTNTFKQAYSFDRWGNRTIDQVNTTTNVPHPAYTANPANNRLNAPDGNDLSYDDAGNLTHDSVFQNQDVMMTYDAENRLSMVDAPNPPNCVSNGEEQICYPTGGNVYRYVYDGEGRRVRRVTESANASNETWQVYGFDGELLAEYPQGGVSVVAQPSKEYGYRNGQMLITAEPWANIALNTVATQSSTQVAGTTAASKAVDGNAEGAMLNGHSSATNSVQNAWWQTDLGSVQNIDNITVWGRTDGYPEMTTNFYLFVSNVAFTSYDLNATINQAGVFNYHYSNYAGPASVPVNRTGRYVRVQLAGTNSLVLGEVQVWGQAAKLNWLVADQLGTPRMIVDKTGAAAAVSRHDYLPFGEELGLVGGRTPTQGYASGDTVRQMFTSKERDGETGLDYFGARYFASNQGRFTSPDKILVDQWKGQPQSWNLYSYVRNTPLKLSDPTGNVADDPKTGEAPACWPKCPLPPGSYPVFTETVDVTADQEPIPIPIPSMDLVGCPASSACARAVKWGGAPIILPIPMVAPEGASEGIVAKLLTWLFGRSQLIGTVTRSALEAAAADAGPTVEVFTTQTGALEAGRSLFLAAGEGAEAMAGAARPGVMYVGRIPKALIETLRSGQLLEEGTLVWKGANTVGVQYYVDSRAIEFVIPFLKPVGP